jgi:transposase
MGFSLVADEWWLEIDPLLPKEPPKPKGGRPPIPNRQCLSGILLVLWSGMAWRRLPKELGCGSGVTCWRRLNEWTKKGIWPQLQQKLLNKLGRKGAIDWSRAVVDSASVRAVFGGRTRERTLRTEGKKAASGTL